VDGLALAVGDEGLALGSASGLGMKSQFCTRASGPTLYQPRAAPSSVMKGNFM
jgi:hypothetical protein